MCNCNCSSVQVTTGEKGDTGATGPIGATGPQGPTGPSGDATMENYNTTSSIDIGAAPNLDIFTTGSADSQGIYYEGTLYFSAQSGVNVTVLPYHGTTEMTSQQTISTVPVLVDDLGAPATAYLTMPVVGYMVVDNGENVGFKITASTPGAVLVLLGTNVNFSRA